MKKLLIATLSTVVSMCFVVATEGMDSSQSQKPSSELQPERKAVYMRWPVQKYKVLEMWGFKGPLLAFLEEAANGSKESDQLFYLAKEITDDEAEIARAIETFDRINDFR